MSELKHNPFVSFRFKRRKNNASLLKVDTISHQARFAVGSVVNADIVLLESASAVTPFFDAINALAADAKDSNPLFEPAGLIAAMEHLPTGSGVQIALVWSDKGPAAARQLIGVFPYQSKRFYLGLPIAIWTIWTHKYNFLATPLLRAGHEHDAMRRFMRFADQAGARLMRFPLFQADGAFGPVLTDIAQERGLPVVETERHERALLDTSLNGEAYLATHMRKKKRKEYTRLWNRLAELGDVSFDTLESKDDLGVWLENFLQLERSGWKGKRGTALAEQQSDAKFFEDLVQGCMAQNKLHVARITLNAKPIAMLVSFIAGDCAYSFKIAFDEDYARYSPGAWLMMKVIDTFHADSRVRWVDSCAIPNHPMIDHIWAERRQMRAVNVATHHPMSSALVVYSEHMTRIVARVWNIARQTYYRLRKEIERDRSDHS
ncbi:MAG: GNAT family N-acetyltransferase [Parvibaculaceae bacterium]